MPDINVQLEQSVFNVVIENKPDISVVLESKPENTLQLIVDTIKGNDSGGTGNSIQTKTFPLSGLSQTISSLTHGFADLLNFYVVKQDMTPVEVVFLINNNNIQILSNISLNNHSIIIKGYN